MAVPRWIIEISDYFKSQEMRNEAARINPLSLPYVLHRFKTKKMCDAVVREGPCELEFASDHFKTQEMCNEAVPIFHTYWSMCQSILRRRRCVIRQCEKTFPLCNMFLIIFRHKKCVMMQ